MTTQEVGPSKDSKASESEEFTVIELTDENFKDGINVEEPTLVLFYTTWCGACKKFKPVFQNAAKELSVKNNLRFAMFDCTDAEEKLDEYNVAYVPVLKLFKKGQFECDYKDKNDFAGLIKFAEKHGSPLSQ